MNFFKLDEDELLIKLWEAGYSCRTIGFHLGRSKNSVISRARKLGLPPHVNMIGRHTLMPKPAEPRKFSWEKA